VAERIAVLDIMSNGRVEFGSGRSITEQELGGFQVNPEDSRAMWEEAVAAIPKMWMNETFSHDGKFFKMPEREVLPKPIQKPHPPMWVAATQPVTWEIAGQKGIGALGFGISEPGLLDNLIAVYKKAIKDCEPVGAFVNDKTAAATICICAPHHEEEKVVEKDANRVTTRKAAELFTRSPSRK
jgi:alkanesulfonate monooxygenase SsuD/methylene tetrahydromethanopterin reductase-like flavin-dependent oxidoreductase (luciferase family)